MVGRIAACSRGKLRVICNGEALRISIRHCLACPLCTGAPFGAQSRFHRAMERSAWTLQGRRVRPIRNRSHSRAAPRPSLMAHTTRLWPRRQSPAAYTPLTLVA